MFLLLLLHFVSSKWQVIVTVFKHRLLLADADVSSQTLRSRRTISVQN